MKYNILKGTGLEVSNICLGTIMYGGQVAENDGVYLTHYALDQGVNLVDTSNSYFEGRSEEIVGKALKGRRDDVILSTKAGFAMGQKPNEKGLSRKHVMQQVEDSLRRLDTDYIDIYFMHLPDYNTPVEESLETYSQLVRSGKVRYIGMSNHAAWQVAKAHHTAKDMGLVLPTVCEMVYNLLTRGIEGEFLPFAREYNKSVITYNPLAAGMLSGKHKRGAPPENSRFTILKAYAPRYWRDDNFDAVEMLEKIAEEEGISLVELAMGWCMQQPGVDSVITGFSRFEQLEQNLKCSEQSPLSQAAAEACDEVWKQVSGNRFKYNR